MSYRYCLHCRSWQIHNETKQAYSCVKCTYTRPHNDNSKWLLVQNDEDIKPFDLKLRGIHIDHQIIKSETALSIKDFHKFKGGNQLL